MVVDPSANPTFGRVGETILYKINVSNEGINGLNNIKIFCDKPLIYNESVTFPINLESLESGEYFSFNASYIIKKGDLPGPFIVSFNATGSSPTCRNRIWPSKPVSVNVIPNDTESLEVIEANISVKKTANASSGLPSDNVSFDINVTNIGKILLEPVIIEDILPAGLNYIGSNPAGTNDSRNISWTLDSIEPGNSTIIKIQTQIDQLASGILLNRVNATGQPPAGYNVTANDTELVEVIGSAISVEKSVVLPYGSPLEKITFGIEVTNIGKLKLDPVIVEDVLPAGLNYIDSNPAGTKRGQNISWLLGSLEPGQSDYIMLLTQINWSASGTLQNWVSATGLTLNGINVTDVDDEIVKVVSCAIIIPPNRGSECCCNNCCDNCCNCPGNITNNIKLNNSGHSIQVITFGNANVSNLSQESKSKVE